MIYVQVNLKRDIDHPSSSLVFLHPGDTDLSLLLSDFVSLGFEMLLDSNLTFTSNPVEVVNMAMGE